MTAPCLLCFTATPDYAVDLAAWPRSSAPEPMVCDECLTAARASGRLADCAVCGDMWTDHRRLLDGQDRPVCRDCELERCDECGTLLSDWWMPCETCELNDATAREVACGLDRDDTP